MVLPRFATKLLEKPTRDFQFQHVAEVKKKDYLLLFVTLALVGVYCYRVLLMVRAPLIGDEAYYWLWAKHLALGYHDHPPFVGWLIALTTFFSNRVFWVRLPALLCSIGATIFFYLFSKEFIGDAKKAKVALLLFMFLPILAIAEVAILPDSSLILSWAFCLWAGWRSLRDGRYWPLTGLAIGFAIMSKLMGFFLLPSFGFFFIMNHKARFWLTQKSFWLGAATSFLVSLPFWVWNTQHHFENFIFQAHDHLGSPQVHPFYSFLAYVGLQITSVSPVLFVLLVVALWSLIKRSASGDPRSQFLLSFFLPIQAFFAMMSVRVDAPQEIHWALVGYLSLLVACADLEGWGKLKRWGLVNCVLFTLLFCIIFVFPVFTAWAVQPIDSAFPTLGINRFLREKDYGELMGYRELASEVSSRLQELPKPSFLLTDSYTLSSDFTYYVGQQARTFLVNGQGAQYLQWNRYQDLRGENAMWIGLYPLASRPQEEGIMKRAFGIVGDTQTIQVQNGPVVRIFYWTPLYNLRNSRVLE